MKPRIKLAEAKTPDGTILALFEQDKSYSISVQGQQLMHSKMTTSEELLGKLGLDRLGNKTNTRILIGGLGLGFTLKTVMRGAQADTQVEIAELLPEVVEWNRSFLKELNGSLLDDPRVDVRTEDVGLVIKKAPPEHYDSILLDVDNGPIAMVATSNNSLYSHFGIRAINAALKADGRAVFWSAQADPRFEKRLRKAGFTVKEVPAKTHPGAKRAAYILYVADR
jgi:spermidine synthase